MKEIRLVVLLLFVCVSIVACNSDSSDLEKRKRLAEKTLNISNGTQGDRAMRAAAGEAIKQLDAKQKESPKLVAFRILPGRGRYIVAAYWVGLEKHADGMEIQFSDGTKVVSEFSKDDIGTNEDALFYSSMVFSERLAAPFNVDQPGLVSQITLTRAGQACSNSVKVTTPADGSTIWKDAIGAYVDDDFELWGFSTPPKKP